MVECKAATPSYSCVTSTWWQNDPEQEAVSTLGHRDTSDLHKSATEKLRGNSSAVRWAQRQLKLSEPSKPIEQDYNDFEMMGQKQHSTQLAPLQTSWTQGAQTAARIHNLPTQLPHAIQSQISISLSQSLTDLSTQTSSRTGSRKEKQIRDCTSCLCKLELLLIKNKKRVYLTYGPQLALSDSNNLPWQSYFNKIKLLLVITALSISVLTKQFFIVVSLKLFGFSPSSHIPHKLP